MRTRLYLITPSKFETGAFARELADALAAGDVAAVQLRMKDAPDADVIAAARVLKPVIQDAGAAFILNDRPDLAAQLDADGVHVGQSDASYAEARRIVGPDRQIGVTCHASSHLAMVAAEAGADYVAFGAFFPSDTKETVHVAGLELLEDWQAMTEIPCVAIGGITVENCAPLVRAGADFLAVANGVWRYAGGAGAAVAAFNAVFDKEAGA